MDYFIASELRSLAELLDKLNSSDLQEGLFIELEVRNANDGKLGTVFYEYEMAEYVFDPHTSNDR